MNAASTKDQSQQPRKRRVAVLGATGAVGQTFIRLLENCAVSSRNALAGFSANRYRAGPIPVFACADRRITLAAESRQNASSL